MREMRDLLKVCDLGVASQHFREAFDTVVTDVPPVKALDGGVELKWAGF